MASENRPLRGHGTKRDKVEAKEIGKAILAVSRRTQLPWPLDLPIRYLDFDLGPKEIQQWLTGIEPPVLTQFAGDRAIHLWFKPTFRLHHGAVSAFAAWTAEDGEF